MDKGSIVHTLYTNRDYSDMDIERLVQQYNLSEILDKDLHPFHFFDNVGFTVF